MFSSHCFQRLVLPKRRHIIAPLIAALLLGIAVPNSFASGAAWPKYDGETLFRGLIFGDGDAAKEFPEIWQRADMKQYMASVPRQLKTNPEQGKTAVMNHLRERDPLFFVNFGVELQSGDHLRIQTAIYDTRPSFKKWLHRRYKPFGATAASTARPTPPEIASRLDQQS